MSDGIPAVIGGLVFAIVFLFFGLCVDVTSIKRDLKRIADALEKRP